jgi:hypothetical protein
MNDETFQAIAHTGALPALSPTVDQSGDVDIFATQATVSGIRGAMNKAFALIENEPSLSPEGKRDAIEKQRPRFEAQANALREKTLQLITSQKASAKKEFETAARLESETLRSTVGPEAYARLIEKQIEVSTPDEILAAFENEFDPATKTLLGHLGYMRLKAGGALGQAAVLGMALNSDSLEKQRHRLSLLESDEEGAPENFDLYRMDRIHAQLGIKGN